MKQFKEAFEILSESEEFKGWKKENNDGKIVEFMEKYIPLCDVFIPFITPLYNESKNCNEEKDLAHNKGKKIIPFLSLQVSEKILLFH